MKRYSLSDKVVTHIFEGEFGTDGSSLSGFHAEAVKNIENNKVKLVGGWPPGQLDRRNSGKTYWAKVKVKIGDKWTGAKASSFFPKPGAGSKWTRDYIILKLEQALTSPTDNIRSSREAWDKEPRELRKIDGTKQLKTIRASGVTCAVTQNAGEIATIYPSTVEDFNEG